MSMNRKNDGLISEEPFSLWPVGDSNRCFKEIVEIKNALSLV